MLKHIRVENLFGSEKYTIWTQEYGSWNIDWLEWLKRLIGDNASKESKEKAFA